MDIDCYREIPQKKKTISEILNTKGLKFNLLFVRFANSKIV